jgi:hypothetical protein
VCNASLGDSLCFIVLFNINYVLRVSLISSIDSYFDSLVAAANDPCTLMRWIGLHKDTHFRLSISLLEKFEICCSDFYMDL